MSVGLIIGIALLVFFLFLAAEVPVAVGLAAGSSTGLLLYAGVAQTGSILSSVAAQATSSYSLVVIPMFVLMGALMANSGVLSNVFDLAARVTRRLPGGLGIATVLSAAGFSAVTGSSAATVTTLGRMCVNEMTKHGYSVRLAASVVAASGTLGPLIPPSIVLVIYGVLTEESVGKLLLAAIIPGILTTIAYSITVIYSTIRERRADAEEPVQVLSTADAVVAPVAAPAAAGAAARSASSGSARLGRLIRWREFEAVAYIAVLGLVVLGGIYGGYMTETEAGAVGALLALVVLLLRARSTERGLRRSMIDALEETATNTSMLMLLVICGSVFTYFLVVTRVPQDLTAWIVGLDANRYVVLAMVLVAFLILGALLDGMSILLLTIPLTYPIMMGLGFDGLWYGVIAVKMIEIGLLTPPFGLNVFMISGIIREAKVESVFRGVLPFILADFAIVGILVAFPELVTWLPSLAAA
jgi:C4-dicarboxylate transporter DctM subunit